jgi:hypothetical protein
VTIENADAVDGAGIDRASGEVVLTISDHLMWEDNRHLPLLEQKIGRYLDFVQSGQLLELIPQAKGRSIRIEVIHKHQPTDLASKFLLAAGRQLKAVGIELSNRELPEGY